MTNSDLPDDSRVIRYIKPTDIGDDGRVNGAAFQLRPDETGLSVNWLDYYSDVAEDERINEVRRVSRLRLSRNGRFAELNVGAAKRAVRRELDALRFVHNPLPPDGEYAADPSHSLILGLPPRRDSPRSAMMEDALARRAQALHVARL